MPQESSEIEVTAEMIEVGLAELYGADLESPSDERLGEALKLAFRRMWEVRQKSSRATSPHQR